MISYCHETIYRSMVFYLILCSTHAYWLLWYWEDKFSSYIAIFSSCWFPFLAKKLVLDGLQYDLCFTKTITEIFWLCFYLNFSHMFILSFIVWRYCNFWWLCNTKELLFIEDYFVKKTCRMDHFLPTCPKSIFYDTTK